MRACIKHSSQLIRDIRLRTDSKTNMAAFYRVTTMYIVYTIQGVSKKTEQI